MGKKRRIMSSNKFKSKNSHLANALSRTKELSDRVDEVVEAVTIPAPEIVKPNPITKVKPATTQRKSTKKSRTTKKTKSTSKK